jgi:hypothetical protein
MRAADAVFAALAELRARRDHGAARAWHGARPRALALRIGKSAGKQEAGVHHRSVRCDARECTENVWLGAVAHGRLVCNKCLPPCRYIRAQRQDGARVEHHFERRALAEAFWRHW